MPTRAEPQAYARAVRRLDELVYRLRHSGRSYPDVLDPVAARRSGFRLRLHPGGLHRARWRQSKEYIRAGDIFQVVLSQRLSVPFRARPVDVYRALRALNPSPYMYFLDLGGTQVVGSLAGDPGAPAGRQDHRAPDRRHPPARRHAIEEDLALEAELLADPKERAEHLMLIDLGRNDVGRVAEPGTRGGAATSS